MSPDYLRSRLVYCENVSAYNLGNTKNKFVLPQFQTDYLKRSFFVQWSSVEELTYRPTCKSSIFTVATVSYNILILSILLGMASMKSSFFFNFLIELLLLIFIVVR